MKNTKDPNINMLEVALAALMAINSSSEFAKATVNKDGNPINQDEELEVIHSIANGVSLMIDKHLENLSVS